MSEFFGMSDDALWERLPAASDRERPEILQTLAWRAVQRENWPQAKAMYEEALAGFAKMGCNADVEQCTHWIARCAAYMGEHDAAIAHHRQVVQMRDERGPLDEFGAMTVDAIGCQHWDAGRHEQALPYFADAARLHHSNGSKKYSVDSARKWICAIDRVGAWEQMADAVAIVLADSDELGDHAAAHMGAARAMCQGAGPRSEMEARLQKARNLVRCHDDQELEVELALTEVMVLTAQGRRVQALKRALDAREVAKAAGTTYLQACLLLAAGALDADRHPKEALALLEQAQAIAEATKDRQLADRASTMILEAQDALSQKGTRNAGPMSRRQRRRGASDAEVDSGGPQTDAGSARVRSGEASDGDAPGFERPAQAPDASQASDVED